MRLVHFSHQGLKRFGVLLPDNRVLDLTHFFPDEQVLRRAGDQGLQTVREAVERAHLRRSVGGTLFALEDVVLENTCLESSSDEELPASTGESASDRCRLWASYAGRPAWNSGFGIHLVRLMRTTRR